MSLALGCALAAVGLGGCAGSAPTPGDPVAPPPAAGAWRPGEALAFLLRPPATGVRSIDESYLESTEHYRLRMKEIDKGQAAFREVEKVDPGGRRVWLFDGPYEVCLLIDIENDGTIDQSQYFGPEGLFAVTHRFAGGRRTQRIFWPPGEPRVVEVRDNLPPYPGVWWRTNENPFRTRDPSEEEGDLTLMGAD